MIEKVNKPSYWVDFGLLMSEIGLHRSNAQREILAYKEENKPIKTHPSSYTVNEFVDRLHYEQEIGREVAMACLERWCDDFKFSSDEVKDILDKERKENIKCSAYGDKPEECELYPDCSDCSGLIQESDILTRLGNNEVQDILEEMGMLDENGNCPYTAEEIFKAGIAYAFKKSIN